MDLSSLPPTVVDNPVHPDRTGLGRASCVDLGCWLVIFLAIPELGMPDFMRHQECLFERRSNVLVNDEENLTIEGCTRAIEDRSVRGAWLHSYAERVGDPDRELIGRPWVAPTFNCLIVQPFGVLSSELYSIHG